MESVICFFCNDNGVLYDKKNWTTNHINRGKKWELLTRDTNIQEASTQLVDTKTLVKLSKDEMIAHDTCYYQVCISSFLNSYRGLINKESKANRKSQQKYWNIALAEIMISVEEVLEKNHAEVASFIKLPSVIKYFQYCFMDLKAGNMSTPLDWKRKYWILNETKVLI